MSDVTGLHHVTCMASKPRTNLEFYTQTLGMRLVKRSVNQDDPGTYHLFYADAVGTPGSDLTFFPWPNLAQGRRGAGEAVEVSLAVPVDSLGYWEARLSEHEVADVRRVERFDEPAVTFRDPDGLDVSLSGTDEGREFSPWEDSPVPESAQVRGLHSVRLLVEDASPTIDVLTGLLDRLEVAESDGWRRFGDPGGTSGSLVDIKGVPDAPSARLGRGSVHHVAWRVADEETERRVRNRVQAAGLHPTSVIDRFWFRSVYFREPGGVLFELATDGPGFGVDEDVDQLGRSLILPPWLEADRERIEAALPPLES